MSARILFISDLHKRYCDSTNVKGQLVAQQKIQEDIINFNKAYGVTHNIVLGDWYDRGFHGIGQAYGAMEMDRRISASVNGQVYLCVGNHFYLERDENPEMYIIQPNPFIRPSISIPVPEKPIFNVVPSININGVQISFFHFNKTNKDYVTHRDPSVKFHIGIYHDDCTVPGNIRAMEGFTGTTSQNYLNSIYANVDLAIHGHIHTKCGVVNIELNNGRSVPLMIPGALGIVSNTENYKHSSVDLPLIDISDDGQITVQTVTFSTHIEDLRFFEVKSKKKKTLPDGTFVMKPGTSLVTSNADLQSLTTYMTKRGYHQYQLNMIEAARSGTLDMLSAINLMMEENLIK